MTTSISKRINTHSPNPHVCSRQHFWTTSLRRTPLVTSGLTGLFFFLLLTNALPARAQHGRIEGAPDTTAISVVVKDVRFEGNVFFSDHELALRVRTQPNRRFLGVGGLTWWLWLYRLGESGFLGDRVGGALMAGGEPPAYLDHNVLAADVERLQLLYTQEGFRDAVVEADVDTVNADQVSVSFIINPGDPTFIRHVEYVGLGPLEPEQQYRLARGTLLRTARVTRDRPLSLDMQDQRYSEPTLLEERRRLLTFLRNEGYASVTRDSIRALVFPQSTDSFDVTFRIHTGRRFRFGDVHFQVDGPEPAAGSRRDTLLLRSPADTLADGLATVHIDGESKLAPSLLTRTLQFRPGEWYSQASVLATKRRLEGTGVFLFTDIAAQPSDTVRMFPGAPPRLPHRAELRTRRRHQLRLETFMLQRSGEGLLTSTTELGTGVGVTYENANLLGRGETFRVQTTGSIAANNELTSLAATQAEIVTSLTYPYLVGPFRGLESAFDLYDARTRFSLSLLTARREDLKLIIRGRGNARYLLEMQHSPTLTSFVDLIDVSLSNPDTLAGFKSEILDRLLRSVADPVQQAQIVEDYTLPQINTALRYTIRSSNVNPLRRDRGYSYEGGIEIGNNLPYLLDRFVYSPDTLEGSLPGLPIFSEEGTPGRLAYRQYVRLVADARRYLSLSRGSVLALKLVGGFAQPTGSADVIPFDRRFYSGGASSVRGWGLRELGPGGAQFTSSDEMDTTVVPTGDVTNILGGDVKLEAGLEVRTSILRNILAADWLGVLFMDAGNVWFGPRNPGFGDEVSGSEDGRFRADSFFREIGVGSGIGLRIAWEYLIIRLDLGVKMYDPRRRPEGLLPDGLGDIQPHFGIGHAF